MLLKIVTSDGKQKTVRTKMEMTGKPITIGRGADADVQIEDEKCSRVHCAIRTWDEMYVIRDMLSRNGTYVNGESIRVTELKAGDVVKIGGTELSLEAEGKEHDLTVLREND